MSAQLVIGNKLYSSWSLRAWLVMKVFDLPFDETVVPLSQASSKQEVLRYSPSGKVPVLIDGDFVVWESMAIIEYLAEMHPLKGIWPSEAAARAHARAASAELHAGFSALRSACPMNLGKRFATRERGEAVAQDVARVTAIFREARARFGSSGAFLCKDFSAMDAMFAPVVTRLETYSIKVDAVSRAYMDAVLSHPAFRAWRTAALAEPWVIAEAEADEEAIEVFRVLRG